MFGKTGLYAKRDCVERGPFSKYLGDGFSVEAAQESELAAQQWNLLDQLRIRGPYVVANEYTRLMAHPLYEVRKIMSGWGPVAMSVRQHLTAQEYITVLTGAGVCDDTLYNKFIEQFSVVGDLSDFTDLFGEHDEKPKKPFINSAFLAHIVSRHFDCSLDLGEALAVAEHGDLVFWSGDAKKFSTGTNGLPMERACLSEISQDAVKYIHPYEGRRFRLSRFAMPGEFENYITLHQAARKKCSDKLLDIYHHGNPNEAIDTLSSGYEALNAAILSVLEFINLNSSEIASFMRRKRGGKITDTRSFKIYLDPKVDENICEVVSRGIPVSARFDGVIHLSVKPVFEIGDTDSSMVMRYASEGAETKIMYIARNETTGPKLKNIRLGLAKDHPNYPRPMFFEQLDIEKEGEKQLEYDVVDYTYLTRANIFQNMAEAINAKMAQLNKLLKTHGPASAVSTLENDPDNWLRVVSN